MVDVGDGILGNPGIGTDGLSVPGEVGISSVVSPGMGTLGSLSRVGEPSGVSTSLIVSPTVKFCSKPDSDLCLARSIFLLGGLRGTIGVSLGLCVFGGAGSVLTSGVESDPVNSEARFSSDLPS